MDVFDLNNGEHIQDIELLDGLNDMVSWLMIIILFNPVPPLLLCSPSPACSLPSRLLLCSYSDATLSVLSLTSLSLCSGPLSLICTPSLSAMLLLAPTHPPFAYNYTALLTCRAKRSPSPLSYQLYSNTSEPPFCPGYTSTLQHGGSSFPCALLCRSFELFPAPPSFSLSFVSLILLVLSSLLFSVWCNPVSACPSHLEFSLWIKVDIVLILHFSRPAWVTKYWIDSTCWAWLKKQANLPD